MGYRHTREEILEAAVATVLEGGMAALTFSKVGARLGISDRTVVYYFASKTELVLAVTQTMGADLIQLLEAAFGPGPSTQAELVATAWPVLTTGAADRVFALFFELMGLAAAGHAPYGALAHSMIDGWVQWLTPRLVGSTPEIRRRRALATVAQIDGLLLVRQMLGAEAADAAAREALKR